MNNNQTQPTNQSNPSRFHLKTWQWLPILVLVAVIVGGMFWYINQYSQMPKEEKILELEGLLNRSSGFKEFFEKTLRENPGLTLNKFSKIRTGSIKSRILGEENRSLIENNPAWILSPDGSRALSTLRYFGEPDSDLEIYNRNNDEKIEVLQFCGTPCEYWGIFWLNNEQFIFIQSAELSCAGECKYISYVLIISFYDLGKNTETVYQSQEIEERPNPPAWPDWEERIREIEEVIKVDDLDLAREVLVEYFSLLNEEKYTEAVKYHGSGYDYIQHSCPKVDLSNYAGLLECGCNFLVCENVNIIKEEKISADEFMFTVQFIYDDGVLKGETAKSYPYCCGEEPPEGVANIPRTEFEYKVKKVGATFFVITPLLYIP